MMMDRPKRRLQYKRQSTLFFVGFIACIVLWFVLIQIWGSYSVAAQDAPEAQELSLPEAQIHPLPETLAQWQDVAHQGDYFAEIKPTPLGYLIWSEFPIKVYVEPVYVEPADNNATGSDRSQNWVTAVTAAMQEWSTYFPLHQVEVEEGADITIWRSAPPIRGFTNNFDTADTTNQPNLPRLPRIRSAETRYQIFIDRSNPAVPRLGHRFMVYLSPNQTPEYIKATARHELGHALGIWGHSPLETDALYFSQVRNPAPISDRDINTLKRIYQQPTRLGWQLEISFEQ